MAGRVAVTSACLMVLSACGGGSVSPTVTVGPTATATTPPPTPAPIPKVKIGKIVWANSVDPVTNAPGKIVSKFPSDAPVIYAVLSVADLRAGSVLAASWTYNDTALRGVAASIVPTALYPGGYVLFQITRAADATWPSGVYGIVITLDGAVVRSATIDIVDS